MAVVGDAFIEIHALTSKVENQIKSSFSGFDRLGEDAGKDISRGLEKGIKDSNSGGGGGGAGGGLSSLFSGLTEGSTNAAEEFTSFARKLHFAIPAVEGVAGVIGVLITSIISLGSVAAVAGAGAILTLVGSLAALGQGALTAGLAFQGVLEAVQAGIKNANGSVADVRAKAAADEAARRSGIDTLKATDAAIYALTITTRTASEAEIAYSLAIIKAKEELRNLAFDSEDAGIKQKKAALALSKARIELARVSDLPPNSNARKEAEIAFKEADLNYRRAIDSSNNLRSQQARNAANGRDTLEKQVAVQQSVVSALDAQTDAQHSLKLAQDSAVENQRRLEYDNKLTQIASTNFYALKASAIAYADALKVLSPEAKAFAAALVSLNPVLKSLEAAAGTLLFPDLITALTTLSKDLVPVLLPLLKATGGVLGEIAIKLANVITNPENLKSLNTIWATGNTVLTSFGIALGNALSAFGLLLAAAAPLVIAFGDWAVNVTAAWKNTLEADKKSGKLKDTISLIIGVMKDLGTIFHNTFGGILNIIQANVGPGSGGQIFLDYFKKISENFKNLKTIDGKPLKTFFALAADNGTKLFDILGKILSGFIKLADSKDFGKFLTQLGVVIDNVSAIGKALEPALPYFGQFLIALSKLGVQLIGFKDTQGIKTFFTILTATVNKLVDFFNTPVGKKLLSALAIITPALAAIGLIVLTVKKTFLISIGLMEKAFIPLKLAANGVSKGLGLFKFAAADAEGGLTLLTGSSVALTIPVEAIAAGIALVVAGFILLYTNSKVLRDALSDLWKFLKEKLKAAFDEIKGTLDKTFNGDAIKTFRNAFKDVGDFIGTFIVPIFKVTLGTAIDGITAGIQFFITLIGTVVKTFQRLWDGLKGIVTGIIDLFKGDFVGGMKKIFGGLFDIITTPFTLVLGVIKDTVNVFIRLYNKTLGKLPSFHIPGTSITLGFPHINELATGGVVHPVAGGVIAKLAEAGRPERVSPLDADGLSVRDRAIITQLSGGGKGGNQINITINPSQGMDERELASIVSRQIAYSLKKGA